MSSILTHLLFREGRGLDMGMLWNVVAGISLLWIVYRVFLVFRKPTEELEEILGIDIPPVPEVTLSSVSSDSALLYWKSPESYFSPLTLAVQVNGVNGPFTRTEATIRINGLQPGRRYGVRVVTTNSAGNPSYSSLIQLQTSPQDGDQYGSKLLSSLDAPPRRVSGARRYSHPPASDKNLQPGRLQDPLHAETESKLKRRLDILRRDEEEAKAQLKEDNEEAESQINTLTNQRNSLKKQVEEKEKDSQELRKKANELEKQCKASQRKKSERERKAQQKRKERQNMRDDISKFEKETTDIGGDIEATERQEIDLNEVHEKKMDAAQRQLEKVMAESASLEEQLREMGIKVKKLEEEREKVEHHMMTADEEQAELREREEAEASERKLQEQQTHYHALWTLVSQCETYRSELLEQLQWLLDQKMKDPSLFYPIAGLDYPHGAAAFGKRPRPKAAASLAINRASHPTYASSANPSPTLAHSFPFSPLNTAFGGFGLMSQQELQNQLTAGAPMSPSADTLLPSDLLGDDDDDHSKRLVSPFSPAPPRLRTGSIPQIYKSGSRDVSGANQDPSSPISVESKSPSLLSSPQHSLTNINRISGMEPRTDDDTGSIGSNLPAPTTGGSSRRIGNLLWSFNRQRDKTNLDDLPALGSLKSGQSQSFPSNPDTAEPEAPANRKAGGIWAPMSSMSSPFGFFNRGNKGPADAVLAGGPSRARRRGILGSKSEHPVDVLTQGSSRPSSTYSFDQVPGAVIEGQYGWTTPESTRARTGPWGQSSSRRESIQHGSTSNLSLNSTPLDPDSTANNSSNSGDQTSTKQPAPIGTERFKIRQRSKAPRLNPNAPSFTTRLLSRGGANELKKKSSEVGSDKGKSKDSSDKDKLKELDALAKSSPRLSQDGHSIATSVSVSESHDSLEPSTSSATHSDTAGTSGSAPKESLMQRITRKSSSSKFSVPWSKSSRKEPSTPGDLEEDPDGDYLGRGLAHLAESTTSTPQSGASDKTPGRGSRSWSRVMGKGRKKSELNMSDAGERSSEAGDGGEEEVELEEEP